MGLRRPVTRPCLRGEGSGWARPTKHTPPTRSGGVARRRSLCVLCVCVCVVALRLRKPVPELNRDLDHQVGLAEQVAALRAAAIARRQRRLPFGVVVFQRLR